jgi:hypothetical protein
MDVHQINAITDVSGALLLGDTRPACCHHYCISLNRFSHCNNNLAPWKSIIDNYSKCSQGNMVNAWRSIYFVLGINQHNKDNKSEL